MERNQTKDSGKGLKCGAYATESIIHGILHSVSHWAWALCPSCIEESLCPGVVSKHGSYGSTVIITSLLSSALL